MDRNVTTARGHYCRRCEYSLDYLQTSRCPECGEPFDLANPATYFEVPGQGRKRKRSLEFAVLTLVGIPGVIWCALYHICKDGHLYYDNMPQWWFYVDCIWVSALLAAAMSAVRSDLKRRFIPFGLLLFLVASWIFAATGCDFFLIELYLVILSVSTIWRVWRQTRLMKAGPADGGPEMGSSFQGYGLGTPAARRGESGE